MESNTVTTSGDAGRNGGQHTWSRDPAPRTEIVAKTQEVAGQLADQARQQMQSQLTQQKERVAETMGGVAQALHAMGDQLRQQDQKAIAECADSMAETADRFFGYLADRDIQQLTGDVEAFARRQPALFLTGAFALGFMASRFFKSSSNGSYAYAGAGNYDTTGYHRSPTAYERAASGSIASTPPAAAGESMAFTTPSDVVSTPAPAAEGERMDTSMPRDAGNEV